MFALLARLIPRWILRLPARTVRLRLTLLYGALFLGSGAVLLAITYLLMRHFTSDALFAPSPAKRLVAPATGHFYLGGRAAHPPAHARRLPPQAQQLLARATRQHAAELHQLLVQSGIALAIMAVVSIALGWLVAGRVLRPLRTMTAAAKGISERNLHERLAIEGPRDELRDLADTVDGLLARLEGAFGAQRRFVANAAHELRTPLTVLRALLEENVTDPVATIDSFRRMSRRLVAIEAELERLLDALLTLASSERGLDHREPFDLSVLTHDVLLAPNPEADRLELDLDARISPAPTTGDPALAERLVANLIDNAARYNVPGGCIQVATGVKAGRAWLSVSNTGPVVPSDQLERLFEPFQRAAAERTTNDQGHGLGLSIVRAIATAHDATITAQPGPRGGLVVAVAFPLVEHDNTLDLSISRRARVNPRRAGARTRTRQTSRRQDPQPTVSTGASLGDSSRECLGMEDAPAIVARDANGERAAGVDPGNTS